MLSTEFRINLYMQTSDFLNKEKLENLDKFMKSCMPQVPYKVENAGAIK